MKQAILGLVLAAAIPAVGWADVAPIRTKTGNLVEAPREGSRVIARLAQGTVVEVLDEQPGWVHVRTAEGQDGFVRTNSVDLGARKPGTLSGAGGTAPAGTDGTAGSTAPPAGGTASAGAPKSVAATNDPGRTGVFGSRDLSATDTSAAGKGFNEQIEGEYRQQHQDLEPFFRQIDEQIQPLLDKYNREEILREFRRQGHLGEFAH